MEKTDLVAVCCYRRSSSRGQDPAQTLLDAVFLVDGLGYLTALARINLAGDLDYSERNIVEKLVQT